MASDPSYALEVALLNTLLGGAQVVVLVGALPCGTPAVLDALARAPDVYPRLELSHLQVVKPLHTTQGSTEIFATLDLWNNTPRGRYANAQLADAVGDRLLAAPPAPAGFRLVTSRFDGVQHLTGGDELTAHSVLTWRFGLVVAS